MSVVQRSSSDPVESGVPRKLPGPGGSARHPGFVDRWVGRAVWLCFASPLSPSGIVLRGLEKVQWQAEADLLRSGLAAAVRIANLAGRRSPFYAGRPGFPREVTAENWSRVPVTTKADLQEHARDMSPGAGRPRGLLTVSKTTSGSTGQVVTVSKNAVAMVYEAAVLARAYRWAGVRYGERQARLWGIPDAVGSQLGRKTKDALLNRHRLAAFGVDEAAFASYVEILRARPAAYLYGYASMLSRFAAYLERIAFDGTELGLKSVISTSEVLTEWERQRLGSTFACRVHNEYGCGEVGMIGFTCERGSMHAMTDCVHVEIVDAAGRACMPGEVGELVITDLHNSAQPLIRYKVGDRASWRGTPCACDRGLPVLEGLYGRSYEIVPTTDGRSFHPESILYAIEWARKSGIDLRRFQAIVKGDGGLTIRYVAPAELRRDTLIGIQSKLEKILGGRIHASWLHVPDIPQEASGKSRLVVVESGAVLRVERGS